MCPKKDKEVQLRDADADVPAKLKVEPKVPWFYMSQNFKAGISITCGDRRIYVRPATGEVGPDGPFPYVTFVEEDGESSGFCVHSEAAFDEVWDK